MAVAYFDPIEVYCSEWKKIHSGYILRPLESNSNQEVCSECNCPRKLKRCGGCYEVAYCSNEHQRLHWKRDHRLKCCSYKIVHGDPETVGRYVVATRY